MQEGSYGKYKSYEYLPRPYKESTVLNKNTIYTALNDSVYNGITYHAGALYKWDGNNNYIQITDTQYVYIETLNQVEGATYDSLGVPESCRYEDNITIGWKESSNQNDNNIWVDSEELIHQNSEYLSTKWFNFYMTVVNNNVSCYISIVNNK